MIYDVVMNEDAIVLGPEPYGEEGQGTLTVRIMAENNSYLPQGDRYVSLYVATKDQLSNAKSWTIVRTSSGAEQNELAYAYPMQKVWTQDDFIVQNPQVGMYLIARINDAEGSLTSMPAGGIRELKELEESDEFGFWSIQKLA